MYSVYKITNLINNKCYIGSSIRVEIRWREHRNTAFNENSPIYNYPLYRAFRKYGLENFLFEVICDDFKTTEEMQNYEKQMIYYYNSYSNGYNQTYETSMSSLARENFLKHNKKISQKCAKVDINNNIIEVYDSYHEAAEKNGYDRRGCASMIRRICKGQIRSVNGNIFKDIDNNGNIKEVIYLTNNRRKKIFAINVLTLEEFYYNSISEAARENNIERARIQKCIRGEQRYSIIHNLIFREMDEYGDIIENKNCPSVEEKVEEYDRTNPVINGERHSITEWCKIYNISTNSYYKRIKNGMSVIEAITTPKRR